MFHSEYCIHGIHVVVEIFISETLNELISFFWYIFSIMHLYISDVAYICFDVAIERPMENVTP